MNFVKTKDPDTAKMLRDAGLQEINKEGNYFVFINDGKLHFAEDKNIVYTDKMSI